MTRLRSIKMISVERTDDNFPCKRSLISRAWDESFMITSNTMRHWWEEELPQYRRNGRKGIEERNRKPTLLARANYDPTWRVKGNPICITRRASYRQRLRYLHYTHTLSFFFFPLRRFSQVLQIRSRWALCTRGKFIAINKMWRKKNFEQKRHFEREGRESILCFFSLDIVKYRNFTFYLRFPFSLIFLEFINY